MRFPPRVLPTLAVLIGAASGCSEPTQPVRERVPTLPTPGAPVVARYIYVVNTASGSHQRLTRGHSPAWSPDGRRLAFVDENEIFVVNADGTARRRLTRAYFPGEKLVVRWSPDGSRIAFIHTHECDSGRRSPTCDWELFVSDADGSNETQILRARDMPPHLLAGWSPDGQSIAFVSGSDLHVIGADGTNLTRLTQQRWVEGADWSPDGRRFALHGGLHAYVMDADGSNLTRLTSDTDSLAVYNVAWSPRGDRIALSSRDPFIIHLHTIHVIDADGTNRIPLATNALRPEWLPGGDGLSFVRLGPDALGGVTDQTWIVSSGGGDPQLWFESFDAAWSPDRRRVAFSKLDRE